MQSGGLISYLNVSLYLDVFWIVGVVEVGHYPGRIDEYRTWLEHSANLGKIA